MIDLRLRFPDEATAIASLSRFRGIDDMGTPLWLTASHAHALDPIGPAPDGVGWLVNLQTADATLADALAPYVVTPAQPVREWA